MWFVYIGWWINTQIIKGVISKKPFNGSKIFFEQE
jgi:hypothetical protein